MNWRLFLAHIVVMTVLFTWHDPIVAQELVDPTRPPAVLSGGPDKPAGAAKLESIIVRGGKRTAIVSGELVGPGDKVGDAVVQRIGDNEVVLRRGATQEVLQLYPDLRKANVKDEKAAGKDPPSHDGIKKLTRKPPSRE